MAETTRSLTVSITNEVAEQTAAMLRRLTVTQWHNAFRGQLTKAETEEMVDNIVLLAATEVWRRLQADGSGDNAAEH